MSAERVDAAEVERAIRLHLVLWAIGRRIGVLGIIVVVVG